MVASKNHQLVAVPTSSAVGGATGPDRTRDGPRAELGATALEWAGDGELGIEPSSTRARDR